MFGEEEVRECWGVCRDYCWSRGDVTFSDIDGEVIRVKRPTR